MIKWLLKKLDKRIAKEVMLYNSRNTVEFMELKMRVDRLETVVSILKKETE